MVSSLFSNNIFFVFVGDVPTCVYMLHPAGGRALTSARLQTAAKSFRPGERKRRGGCAAEHVAGAEQQAPGNIFQIIS